MSILGSAIEVAISEMTARGVARQATISRTARTPNGQYQGARPDAIVNADLPRLRVSDPRTVWPKHERGCLLDREEGLYVCVTHGLSLGWLV